MKRLHELITVAAWATLRTEVKEIGATPESSCKWQWGQGDKLITKLIMSAVNEI